MAFYIIDDVFGDDRPGSPGTVPTYIPTTGNWDPVGGTCAQCTPGAFFAVPLDASKVQSGTWHTTTMNPGEPVTTFSVTFTGTQVSVYCLLPPYLGTLITTSMNLSFTLDGQLVGSYERATSLAADWVYNASVWDSPQLDNKEHSLVVEPLPGSNSSFVAFDYLRYQFEEPSTAANALTPTSIVVPPTSLSTTLPPPSSSIRSSVISSSTSVPTLPTSPIFPSSSLSVVTSSSLTSLTAPSSSSPAASSASSRPTQHVEPDTNSTTPRSKVSVATIAGAAGGGALALFLLFFLVYCLRRRRSSVMHKPSAEQAKRQLTSTRGPRPAMTPYTLTVPSTSTSAWGTDPYAENDAEHVQKLPAVKTMRALALEPNRTNMQEGLQRMEEEVRRLAEGHGTEGAVEVIDLRREIERVRTLIEELTRALPARPDSDSEPPPSYAAGSYIAD